MSTTKYESEVKQLPYSQDIVYGKLSDLRNLEALRARLSDPVAAEQMKASLPKEVTAEQLEQFRSYLEKMELGEDFIKIDSPVGKVTLRIVEREEPKLLKFEGEGAPLPLCLWIQLLPSGEGCKLRVTVGAEVSIFMKAMVNKPLQKAADGLADMLARLPYGVL